MRGGPSPRRTVRSAAMEQTITTHEVDTASPAPAEDEGALVEEELLIEEISIDGMCGVY
jgi:mycofactocin precursor